MVKGAVFHHKHNNVFQAVEFRGHPLHSPEEWIVNLTGQNVSLKNTEGQYGFGQLMDSLLTFDETDARERERQEDKCLELQ
jgi:hypothetical protein